MTVSISHLSEISPKAELGNNVTIGPFCVVGPHVVLGDDCKLDSHVTIVGNTTIGQGNRFWPNVVIGAEPQDIAYQDSNTKVAIGDDNIFREGVTVNRGAEKEDGVTRIGNRNLFMCNSHIAHNCHIFNKVILVNGVLLGGHVHVQDGAIISGNSAVQHFSTVGTLAFIGGVSRVIVDVAPYMLASGCDRFAVRTINKVGMRRNGISDSTIKIIKKAYKLIFREHKKLDEIKNFFAAELEDVIPIELSTLFKFLDLQQQGKMGRAREVFRNQNPPEAKEEQTQRRRAA